MSDLGLGSGVVSMRRLGAALFARRSADRTSLAALSRRSGGWWLPDELLKVERGQADLDASEIISLVRLYRVPPAPLPAGRWVTLVIDRSGPTPEGPTGVRNFEEVCRRLVAFGRLLDFEPSGRWVVELAEAMSLAELTVARELERWSADQEQLSEDGSDLAAQVVVPLLGLAIGELPEGTAVLARPADAPRHGAPRLAAGPLRQLLHPAAA